jgi:ribosomal protein S30
MLKRSTGLLCVLVLAVTACNYRKAGTVINQTPSPTPYQNSAGGTAQLPVVREVGDTSTDSFTGTAGKVEKKDPAIPPATLSSIRTGDHQSFDRVVFEFSGTDLPGYHVEYIDHPVRSCGSGEVVEISGQGFLQVRLQPAQAHDENGQPTITTRELKPGLPLIQEMKIVCDFEADVEWILGLAKPNRYRVLELLKPPRLVIDIKR